LERDIDKAISILLQAKHDVHRGTAYQPKKLLFINETMGLKDTTQLLNMINVFRVLPVKEPSKNIQKITKKSPGNNQTAI